MTPYYYAAANAIDWSLPAPRIGDRHKPLREKTIRRIADGLQKFAHTPRSSSTVSPFLVNLNHPSVRPIVLEEQPYATQTAYDATGLVTPPFLLDHLGEYRPRSIEGPCSTICAAGNHHSLIVPPGRPSWLMTYYHHGQLAPIQEAAPTVTTLERHALVTHTSCEKTIGVEDCGVRMLTPKEIQAAMAFPPEYVVTGIRREQVKQLGNAVTPPVMKMLMERVITSLA